MARARQHDRDRVEDFELGGGGDFVVRIEGPLSIANRASCSVMLILAMPLLLVWPVSPCQCSVKISRQQFMPCCSIVVGVATRGGVVKLGVQKLRARSFCHSSVLTAAASAFFPIGNLGAAHALRADHAAPRREYAVDALLAQLSVRSPLRLRAAAAQ
jgi:hypothetical protein